jgi:hypothetical protein
VGADFPGVVHPLDGVERRMAGDAGMYQYFLKVVPTLYQQMRGGAVATNQFSVTAGGVTGRDRAHTPSLHAFT